MITRSDICATALTWLGTPYQHAQCVRGVATDCISLLIGVARELALLPPDWHAPYYSPEWHVHHHTEMLLETLTQLGAPCLPLDARQPGDILLMRFGRTVSHAGILLPGDRLIHAVRSVGRVVVTGLRGEWLARLAACYAFPGLEDLP